MEVGVGSNAELEIQILGPVQAVLRGRVIKLGPPLQRGCLVALAVDAGKTVSTTELTERLWGDSAPATAHKSLHKYVSQLRKLVGSRAVRRDGRGYRLDVEPGQVDASLVETGIAALADEPRAERRLDRLDELLASFRGETLADLDTHFAVLERARLVELRLTAVEARAEALIADDQLDTAIAWINRHIAQFPYRESLVEQLMLAYYAVGRQVDALAAYQRVRRHLTEDLGVEPGPALRALERRLLVHDPSLPVHEIERPADSGPVQVEERRQIGLLAIAAAGSSNDGIPAARGPIITEIALNHGGRLVARDREEHGDGVTLVAFGLPAHGDEVIRAGEAALRLSGPHDLRCFVAFGDAVVNEDDGSLAVDGDVVARALDAVLTVPPGGVGVDKNSMEAVAGRAVVQPSNGDWFGLESLTGDVEVDYAGPFVGRTEELERLASLWHACVATGDQQLATIVGESGIGKTHLLAELRHLGAPRYLRTACLPRGDGAFGPIVALVHSAFGDQPMGEIERVLVAAELDPSERVWLQNHAALLFDDEPHATGDTYERNRAWARLIDVALGPAGGVVAIDDAHRASTALSEFVSELLELSESPLLVIGTGREEPFADATKIRTDRPSTVMTLGPLEYPSALRLVATVLDTESPDLAPVVAKRAGGNPLFLRELARAATNSGATDLPDSVRAAIVANIDCAGRLACVTLQAVAVVGAPVKPGLVAAALGVPAGGLSHALAELRRRRLIKTVVDQPGVFEVAHALVGEVAAELTTDARRLEIHEGAVHWYSNSDRPHTLDELERIALLSSELVALAELVDDARVEDFRQQSAEALSALGTRVASIDAARSQQILEEALARFVPGSVDWAWAALAAGRAATDRGDWARSEQLLRLAIDYFGNLGVATGEAQARVALDIRRQLRGDEGVGDETERALQLLRATPGPELANALSRQLTILAAAGHVQRSVDLAHQADDVLRQHGSDEDRARAMNATAFARLELGEPGALHDLRATLEFCVETGLTRQATVAYNNLGNNTWFHVGPNQAIPVLTEAISFATERKHSFMARFASSTLSEACLDAGHWNRALRLSEQAMADDDPSTPSRAGDTAARVAGLVHLWRGDLDRARSLLCMSRLDRARALGDLQHVGPWLVAAASVAIIGGDAAQAVDLVVEMSERTSSDDRWRCAAVHDAVQVLIAAGRADLAASIVPGDEQPVPRAELSRLSALARVEHSHGDIDRALATYRRALAGWERFDAPLELAIVAHGQADCLRATGHVHDATRLARRAARQLAALGVDHRPPLLQAPISAASPSPIFSAF